MTNIPKQTRFYGDCPDCKGNKNDEFDFCPKCYEREKNPSVIQNLKKAKCKFCGKILERGEGTFFKGKHSSTPGYKCSKGTGCNCN